MKNLIKKLEWWLLVKLLKRYSSNTLDQWDLFKVNSKFGTVFIAISREPISGSERSYTLIGEQQ